VKCRQHTEAAPVRQAQDLERLPSGGALHVEGPRDGRPILFLHGVAGAAWSWEPQAAALAGTFLCASWEGRGHGAAGRVADAGLADYFADALEALERVRPAGPAIVAGHSMGGLLAMALAAERPADVAGLLLVEPVYNPSGLPHAAGLFAGVARWVISPLAYSVATNNAFAKLTARMMFEQSFEDRSAMEIWWARQREQVPLEYPRMFYEAFEGTSGFPNRAFAREIACPVTLLEGSAAKSGPRFRQLVDQFRDRLGGRFVYEVIPGGHYLQLDRPDAVTGALRDLAARLQPGEVRA
jgi:pimeloyl-ACP methyl ester carboxylesterase